MTPVWMGQGEISWLEPESDEEREFIKSCPEGWTWEQIVEAWDGYAS